LHLNYEPSKQINVDNEVQMLNQSIAEDQHKLAKAQCNNVNSTNNWSSNIERSKWDENSGAMQCIDSNDVKLEFVRPDFDLEPDFPVAEKKHPYYSQLAFNESEVLLCNMVMPEIQMPVIEQARNFTEGYSVEDKETRFPSQYPIAISDTDDSDKAFPGWSLNTYPKQIMT